MRAIHTEKFPSKFRNLKFAKMEEFTPQLNQPLIRAARDLGFTTYATKNSKKDKRANVQIKKEFATHDGLLHLSYIISVST